jgi:hypothetical protein
MVAINSNCDDDPGLCIAGGRQDQWLKADLAANPKTCTLAYWHHPLFSSGHDHDNGGMMRPIFTTLYNAGVDVVLVGHSHDYERFAPQTPSGGLNTSYGITEFVIGTGGASFTGSSGREPNSLAFNNATHGVLRLTLRATGYDWQFVPEAGKTFTDSGSASCHSAPTQGLAPGPAGLALLNSPLHEVGDATLPRWTVAQRRARRR